MILLDTHIFVWACLEPKRLSTAARKALRRDSERAMADISLREIAALERAGRLSFGVALSDWLEAALEETKVEVIPITPRIAARSVNIAAHFHGDPADRLIAATAIELDVPLMTADERLRASPALRTIW
ncbi:MAG: type II toxin-antitoxin system VapC family toxin [Myxococcaceae bacterium]|nr:type II toxin-antitoxin system VapC family toxin [Myxococcaceae bacterium]